MAKKLPLHRLQKFDLVAHLERQRDFSLHTFGPGDRNLGITDHISKELAEVGAAWRVHGPGGRQVLAEWADVIILALDGAWRAGFSPAEIAGAIEAKQVINENRKWPDWRSADPNKATEHDRTFAAGLEVGARVRFLREGVGRRVAEFNAAFDRVFTVKTIGRHSEVEGAGDYVELDELVGYFAPHVFERVPEDDRST